MRPYTTPCRPPLWAKGGHAQTILGHVLPSPDGMVQESTGYNRHEVCVGDGDRLVVFARRGTTGARVILLHGLSGHANAEYMRLAAAALSADGHGIWAVNHRGCGAGQGLAGRPYHSGKTDDLAAVLAASYADAPDLKHIVVGFSLSGNLALLHSAQGLQPAPTGIVAVNPPVDLEDTSVAIGRGLSRLYERRFMWRLRRAVRQREAAGQTKGSYDIPLNLSLLEFDDLFTAPECGFASGMDYYRRCSSLMHLGRVTTPSVILTAADDPFVDPAVYGRAQLPDSMHLHVEQHGGHVGYLTRQKLGWERWLKGALSHYVAELLG
ncbi:MAG: putative alpha/beta-fold hydrolase [Planctomycetota bacterium]|jgi:predicted alpha/beta-fold hydrolase